MNSASPKPQIVDQEVRDAVLARERSFIVQAPAGSGKTELLIQRYLTLLADPAVDEPELVLAITFTRKAAAEMRNRVRDALDTAGSPATQDTQIEAHKQKTRDLASAVLARDAECGWNLLHDISRINIRTLDSLCEQIAQSGPYRAGFGSRLAVTDDARNLYREAARRTVLMLGGSDEAISAALERLLDANDAQAPTLQTLLTEMLQKRDQWLPILERGRTNPRGLRAELEQSLGVALAEELAEICRHMSEAFGARLAELLAFAKAAGQTEQYELLAGLTALPEPKAANLAHWRKLREFCFVKGNTIRKKIEGLAGKQKQQFASLLEDLAASEYAEQLCDISKRITLLPDPVYSDAEWQRLQSLFTVLPEADRALSALFAERGETDFIQVARAAVSVLSGKDSDYSHSAALRHILVDEFQDTSVLQVGLLRALMSSWQPDDGRTIFLVGDPMQSIYSFRKAEVTLFERARRRDARLLPREIDPQEINVNFRSQAGLVNWFNRTFAKIMTGASELTGAVGHVHATAVHPAEAATIEVRSFPFNDLPSEAEYIAESIRRELDTNRDPAFRVAVLVRARTHLSQIVPALRRRDIGFRAVDIDPLAERTAVRDLLALASALTHPGDRTSWLAVLRAPFCGLTLEDLATLCGDRESHGAAVLSLLNARRTRLSADAQARLSRVLPVLESAIAQRGRMSLRALVERTWSALGGPGSVRREEMGDSDLRDAEAFFEFLDHEAVGGELPDDESLRQALAGLYSQHDTASDARVELMTIHKAKGLQFDVVFVPGLDRAVRPEGRTLLYWRELTVGGSPQLLLAPFDPLHDPEDDDPTIAGYIKRGQADCRREESKRLLYVACTRAKRRLYLSFNRPEDKKNGDAGKPPKDSLLALLQGIESFDSITQDGPSAVPASEAAAPNLRRLKADWAPPRVEPAFSWSAPRRLERDHTFEWVGRKQRAVGTVTHRFLQQIGRDGLDRWTEAAVRERATAIRAALSSEGVNAADLAAATGEVIDGLCAILAHDKGRWILAAHAEADCEFPLSGIDDGIDVRLKLDRTFVDEHGTRWIVDYKMATTTSTAVKKFLDQQQEKYRRDLERYARVMQQFDPRPVRLGLYFPLLREWREIEYTQNAETQGSLFPE
jgi:ATP-dependent exoDNAse (exonuclease V) beta subunit